MKTNNSYPKLSNIKNKLRPKSFSEGNDIINEFPKHDPLIINQDYTEISEVTHPIVNNTNLVKNIDYIEIIYNKYIGFLFHLLLIATFELIFFNYYIIQFEIDSLIQLTDQLINPIIHSCNNLSNKSKIIVDDFINIFINETVINNNAQNDLNNRNIFNHTLMIQSIYYYLGVIIIFILSLSINIWLKRKIDFPMIFLDNIIMISILGIYEYIFFKNIIFKYNMISPNELIKNIMVNLLHAC